MITLHGVSADDWKALAEGAPLVPASLAVEGFIHTTIGPEDFAAALNRHYSGDARVYLCLIVDLDRVSPAWEVSTYPHLTGEYPHIRGPLNRDAVIGIVPVPRDEAGRFLPPRLPAIPA